MTSTMPTPSVRTTPIAAIEKKPMRYRFMTRVKGSMSRSLLLPFSNSVRVLLELGLGGRSRHEGRVSQAREAPEPIGRPGGDQSCSMARHGRGDRHHEGVATSPATSAGTPREPVGWVPVATKSAGRLGKNGRGWSLG